MREYTKMEDKPKELVDHSDGIPLGFVCGVCMQASVFVRTHHDHMWLLSTYTTQKHDRNKRLKVRP